MMKPHAFLIMAHDNFKTLGTLLSLLDHPRSVIFLHVDKKTHLPKGFDPAVLIKRGKLVLLPSMPVYWGGVSQIRCEFSLLRRAMAWGEFAFFHFLSGTDLPLRPIEEILSFFDENEGKEFVHVEEEPCCKETSLRYRLYYPLQELRGARRVPWLRESLLVLQRKLGVDRANGEREARLKGSAYFSITPAFARFLLSKEGETLRQYRATFCCDEIFLPTLLRESPFWENRYHEEGKPSHLRLIDWSKGNPYVFKSEDAQTLFSSPCLFARKFSDDSPTLLIRMIEKNKKTL